MNVGTKIIAVYSVGNYQRPCVTLLATMMHCLDGGTDSRSTLCVNLIYFNNDNLSKLDRYDRAAKVGILVKGGWLLKSCGFSKFI